MAAHWGTFNKSDSLAHCNAVASAALEDDGLTVANTSADGPQFLLGYRAAVTVSVFLYPAGPANTRITVIAFSDDSATAEGARNRVRQRIVENAFFQPTMSPWAVLLCKFNDNATEPFPRSFYDDLFTRSGVGTHNMVDYFREVSHRRIDTSGTRVFGWYTLPKKRADYVGSGANPAGRDELVAWARQAATDAGVNLSPYVGVVVCMNVPTDLFGGGGRVVCDNGSMEPSALGQEMGHGYGLSHSRANGSTADYMDRWDTMSTWDSVYMASHPRYTLIGPILNAANMSGRAWLDESRVWNAPATGSGTTVSLRPQNRYDLPGWLAARVGSFLIEFRVKESWDAAIPEPAILVHRFEANQSYIMSGTTGRQDLVTGSVFQSGDPGMPFSPWIWVQVSGIDAAGRTATIQVVYRPAFRFPFPRIGSGITAAEAEADSGMVILGDRVVSVPRQSPAFGILTQVALMHENDASAGGQSESPGATGYAAKVEQVHYDSPAPKQTSAGIEADGPGGGWATGGGHLDQGIEQVRNSQALPLHLDTEGKAGEEGVTPATFAGGVDHRMDQTQYSSPAPPDGPAEGRTDFELARQGKY